ncbi:hypothetical protein QBC34DRAFT_495369 [Podospora aff. communis PSN243]|uniref:F-box domain-containing protein n=1 Tax=Podospora aff. communis PSN243 TaxID=3040156 RepID=A0AAV9GL40_9PEZI|nr:hypothetical protein QBC34DRAFT_495369 [Podospora aff. communis PSN243]
MARQQPAPILPSLPWELEDAIFQQLLPHGPVTTRQSTSDNPKITRCHADFSVTLASICRSSRRFNQIATRILYKKVILGDIAQLILFFRTIATTSRLRKFVRSLVWVGFIPPSELVAEDHRFTSPRSMMALVGDTWMLDTVKSCWAEIRWPPPGDKSLDRVVRRLGLSDQVHFSSGHILGAVISLCPRLESLFSVLNQTDKMIISPKGRVLRRCPEFSGLLQIPEWDLFQYHSPLPGSVPYPLQCSFLESLKRISIEPHSDRNAESYWSVFALEPILRSCPKIEGVEIKGTASWRELQTRGNAWQPPAVSADSVKQLILTRGIHPEDSLSTIVETFPKLESLFAEFVETSHAGTYRAWLTKQHFQDALVSVSDTLETLHFTSAPGETWQFVGIEPLLDPVLRELSTLKHLTTEFAWLFGRENIDFVCDASYLPDTLVSLHLLDFWGVAGVAYQPKFLNGIGSLEFLGNVLGGLLEAKKSGRFPDLKAVRVSSPSAAALGVAGSTMNPNTSTKAAEEFGSSFAARFREHGVELSLAELDGRMEHGQWSWSSISF